MRTRLHLPSPATVIALVALLAALAGSAGANPVTAVTKLIDGKNIKPNSITGKQIRDRSLTAKDFKVGSLAAGAPGPKGDTGAQGLKGDTGAQGLKGDTGTVDTSNFFNKAQSDARYRTPLGTSVSLPGVAFHSLGGTAALAETYPAIGAVNPAAGTDPIFYSALPLPNGATITSVSFNGLDNDATHNIIVRIGGAADGATGDGSLALTLASAGQDGSYQTFTLPAPGPMVVDTSQSGAWASIQFEGSASNANLVVVRVTVTYTLPS